MDEIKGELKYNALMCGGYGMSKTITLLMNWHLCNYISTLNFQAQQKPKVN
jgi:hypothetical protein